MCENYSCYFLRLLTEIIEGALRKQVDTIKIGLHDGILDYVNLFFTRAFTILLSV